MNDGIAPEFVDMGWPGALKCPCCGGTYLHHGEVEVWNRRNEDDKYGNYACVYGSTVTTCSTAPMAGLNPSSRRDGLTISFMCEECHGYDETDSSTKPTFKLHIAQHKGTTFAYWDKDAGFPK